MLALGDYGAALAPTLLLLGLALAVLPLLDRRSPWVRVVLLGITVLLAWRYMAWRMVETIPPLGLDFDAIFGWLFALLEAGTLVSSTFAIVIVRLASTVLTSFTSRRLPR